MEGFEFAGCVELKELLGKKADNELALLELIEEVPIDSIYYHTHSYFLRHFYIAGTYPNDFANWVAIQVRDRVLGEKLACVIPSQDKNLESVRQELVEIIDKHLFTTKKIYSITQGGAFHFMKSRIIEVSTGVRANNFQEFKQALKTIDASAIYNHIFEARWRVKKGRSDFALWFEEGLGMKELADKFEKVDCYMYSLEGLREKLLELCENEERS